MLVLSAMGLILLRIGIPVVLLVTLGLVIDRWQTRRAQDVQQQYAIGTVPEQASVETQDQAAHTHVA